MDSIVSPATGPTKSGLTKNKVLIALGSVLLVVGVSAYVFSSESTIYKGSIADAPAYDCSVDAADGVPETYVAGRGCVALSQLEAEKNAAQQAAQQNDVVPVVENVAEVPAVENQNEQNNDVPAVPVEEVAVVQEPAIVAVADDAVGGPGGVTSSSEEALFKIQMIEQQLAIKKANEEKAAQEEIAAQAQKEREAQAAAYAAALRAAKNKSLGIVEPEVLPAVAPVLSEQSDASSENTATVDNPLVEPIANPIVDQSLLEAPLDETNSAPEAATVQSEAQQVMAQNARAATTAASSNGLHGAAIRGETGPEVLLYPALAALTQGTYLLSKRKK